MDRHIGHLNDTADAESYSETSLNPGARATDYIFAYGKLRASLSGSMVLVLPPDQFVVITNEWTSLPNPEYDFRWVITPGLYNVL